MTWTEGLPCARSCSQHFTHRDSIPQIQGAGILTPPILQINGGSERSFIRDSKAGKGEAMKSNPRAWPSTSM